MARSKVNCISVLCRYKYKQGQKAANALVVHCGAENALNAIPLHSSTFVVSETREVLFTRGSRDLLIDND